jgi:phosphate transport system substrate-binding protein
MRFSVRNAKLIAAAFVFISSQLASAEETIKVASGSQVLFSVNAVKAAFEKDEKVKIEQLKEEGLAADSVLIAVAGGKAELGLLGATHEGLTKLVKEKKLEVSNYSAIQLKVVGYDKINFITYKGGPKELSKDQLKGIFTGKITNWKEVGGQDVPVILALPTNSPATQKLISTKVLDGEEFFKKGVKQLSTAAELPKFLASTKGAISFGPSSMKSEDLNFPKHPEVSRPIGAITLNAPSARAANLIDRIEKGLAKGN